MDYIIHEDGTFDIIGSRIRLHGSYPSIDGRHLRPVMVECGRDWIVYSLPGGGKVRLGFNFDTDRSRLLLNAHVKGLPGMHDLLPLAGAWTEGACKVFAQGFGMEGPSGIYDLPYGNSSFPKGTEGGNAAGNGFGAEPEIPVSHGLTALFSGKNVLLAYAEDHRHYSTAFRLEPGENMFRRNTGHVHAGQKMLFSGGFNLEGTKGEEVSLPSLCFEEASEGIEAGLRHCAERIAGKMKARHVMPPAFFWSSWYYAYETMDQEDLDELLSGIKSEKLPFRYIEIDAGYTPALGDWLVPNHRWPGGLKRAAESILSSGFRPGIWVAPFIVGDRSELYRKHPDWVLRDRGGEPVVQLRCYTEPKIWGNPDCNYYVLDTSHPEALRYIEDVFKSLRSYGFELFKTDFMLWSMHDSASVRRHDPTLTSVEIMRKTLSAIRNAIGEESFLLGCIAPFMPFIGYADGMRLAGDCGAQWAESYGPLNMLRELPCDNYFNHVFWQNDPDAMLLRDFDTMLTAEEVRSLAVLQAISGGAVSTSDPPHRLSEDRKRLIRLLMPPVGKTPIRTTSPETTPIRTTSPETTPSRTTSPETTPSGTKSIETPSDGTNGIRTEFPYLGQDRKELLAILRLKQGNVVFVMNPTEEPLTVFFRLEDFFGEGDWYQYRYEFEEKDEPVFPASASLYRNSERQKSTLIGEEKPISVKDGVFASRLSPHSSALVFVTREALREKPMNIWEW